nr:MAG TPA: hypothetical protein [Caudoviricetes sp.]
MLFYFGLACWAVSGNWGNGSSCSPRFLDSGIVGALNPNCAARAASETLDGENSTLMAVIQSRLTAIHAP